MSLIHCPECQKRISDQATICPQCGKPITPELITKAKKSNTVSIVIALGLLIVLYFVCSNVMRPHPISPIEKAQKNAAEAARACIDTVMAIAAAQEMVRRILKAPSTAKFGSAVSSCDGLCTFGVCGPVDAQNSFGAILRQTYCVKLLYTTNTKVWRSLSITLDGKTIK
jgi:hypothetical protein